MDQHPQARVLRFLPQERPYFLVSCFVKDEQTIRSRQKAKTAAIATRHFHTLPGMFFAQVFFFALALARAGQINQIARPRVPCRVASFTQAGAAAQNDEHR